MSTKTMSNKVYEKTPDEMLARLRVLAISHSTVSSLHHAVNEIKTGDENKRSLTAIDSREFRELSCKLLNNEDVVSDSDFFLQLLR